MSEVISWKLTKVILNAQLDKPRNMITGTSNWACYVAGKIQEAYPSQPPRNTAAVSREEVLELIQLTTSLEAMVDGPVPSDLSTRLHALLLKTTEDASDASTKD